MSLQMDVPRNQWYIQEELNPVAAHQHRNRQHGVCRYFRNHPHVRTAAHIDRILIIALQIRQANQLPTTHRERRAQRR